MPTTEVIRTFGDHLIQFAQTVGILPTNVYWELLARVERYFQDQLNANFFAVVLHKFSKGQPWLIGEWPHGVPWWNSPLKQDDGKYGCHAALAYALGQSLWIVAENGEPLNGTTSYKDLLKAVPGLDIPRYAQISDVPARTSILQPLKTTAEHFGVMNVESVVRLPPTDPWLRELTKIARAISILYVQKDNFKLREQSTFEAKRRLEIGDFPILSPIRHMFLASAAKADDEVVGVLKEVLDGPRSGYDLLLQWTEPQPGSISQRICDNLSTCTFGACYLSEFAEPASRYRYRDNANVLFEAGMLLALRKNRSSSVQDLLLVREPDSPSLPFDLSDERMLIVPRVQGGELNKEAFRNEVRKHTTAMGIDVLDSSSLQ